MHEIHVFELWIETNVYDPRSFYDIALLLITIHAGLQLGHIVAFSSSKMKSLVDPRVELVVSFISFIAFSLGYDKHCSWKNLCMRRRNIWDTELKKT